MSGEITGNSKVYEYKIGMTTVRFVLRCFDDASVMDGQSASAETFRDRTHEQDDNNAQHGRRNS